MSSFFYLVINLSLKGGKLRKLCLCSQLLYIWEIEIILQIFLDKYLELRVYSSKEVGQNHPTFVLLTALLKQPSWIWALIYRFLFVMFLY